MIFTDQMKNMKIYRRPLFLPTLEDNKKKRSAIFLLTPNADSSKRMMTNPLLINRLRYQGWYMEQDLLYIVSGKEMKQDLEENYLYKNPYEEYCYLSEMTAKERKELSESDFGLPEKRKYPMPDADHVRSAIKFFNYVGKNEESTLAKNIIKKMKEFNVTDIKVGKNNRFYPYYQKAFGKEELVNESVYSYNMMNYPENPKISVSGILKDNLGRILLLDHKKCNALSLPGGKIEPHESLEDAIRRELYEEIGIEIEDMTLIDNGKLFLCEYPYGSNEYVWFKDYSFEINLFSGTIYNKESEKHRDLIWMDPKEVDYENASELLKSYLDSLTEESDTEMNADWLDEDVDYLNLGNNRSLVFFNEDAKYDPVLRRIFYDDRIKKRSQMMQIDKRMKTELPFIKYAYPDLKQYNQNNIFVDLYFYNQIFFKNNSWEQKRGFDLYLDLLERLINDKRLTNAGYEKFTIFIPIHDWNKQGVRMWMYREDINPISIFYELMRSNSTRIAKIFGNKDIVFFGGNNYFKINFSTLEKGMTLQKLGEKFKLFIIKMVSNQEFEASDMGEEKETSKSISTTIMDDIEQSKGVDLTPRAAAVKKKKEEMQAQEKKDTPKGHPVRIMDPLLDNKAKDKSLPAEEAEKELKDKKLSKGANTDDLAKREKELEDLANAIDTISQNSVDTDDAYDKLDQNTIKDILIDLDSMKDDSVKVSAGRTSRMNQLDKAFLDKKVNGKTVKDILQEDPANTELDHTKLDVSTPNEDWKDLSYMNFDKDYDLNRDIIACIEHFTHVSNPLAIRNLDVKDNSTSEDRLDLYTIEMEDSRGKRFTVKMDIPKMKDNRFLLRGNNKSIQTQFFNMPIIKTDLDTCQVITNYRKIFILRHNTVQGRSIPYSSRIIKALQKYEGNKIKCSWGDNSKVCNKYELPIDYIDLASALNMIETDNYEIYFNQDEIRMKYPNIDDSLGIPIGINKTTKEVIYYTIDELGQLCFSLRLLDLVYDEDLLEIYDRTKPSTSGTYSRCNILNQKIPMILILGYVEGLTTILKKANIDYEIKESLTKEDRDSFKRNRTYVKFKDGYLVYTISYPACMLLNGLYDCDAENYSIMDIDSKNIYIEMLDDYGGRTIADGLDNFYDCLIDPITKENLEYYKLPTTFAEVLLYANVLLSDNKFIKHTDTSSRRIRRTEMIAAYAYEALSESYGSYATQMKHNRSMAEFSMKQSAVIDKFLASPISSDDSVLNALQAVETTNAITFKGKAGLNDSRSYSLDKRTYDDSMINVLGMSTGFSANVGITRQTTMDMNVQGARGYVKTIDGDTSKMNTAKTLTATEALTPFGSTRDDAQRTAMTFIQTAKHAMRTDQSDPLLVTSGADEALAYMTTDKFAYKAKKDGTVTELTEDYLIVTYVDGTSEYINLKETVEKNSDGGFYVPLKLDANNLKVGKKFKQNDILAYDPLSFSNSVGETDHIAYNIGKLAKIAIINTDDGFEDAGIVTESMSHKLATDIIKKQDHNIDKDSNVFSMVKVGDEVDVDDALLVWQNPHEEEEANILLRIMGDDQETVSELGRKAIRAEIAGRVADIRITRTVEIEELSPSLQKIVNDYEKPILKTKKKLDSMGIPTSELPATYKLDQTGKLKNVDGVLIEFFIQYKDIIASGDKITYYSANKATIKNVIPMEDAPYTDFRPNEPIEAFVSQTSIDKRMVTSTMIYGSLQKLMVELDRSVKDMAGIPYDDSKV